MAGQSPFELIRSISRQLASAQRVLPTGAAAITVTSAGGAWALGDFSNDIIAANAVGLPFYLHGAVVSGESANAQYELVFYYGQTDIECSRVAFVRINATLSSSQLSIQTPLIPANSRVRAKLMDSVGGSSCAVKLLFHTY